MLGSEPPIIRELFPPQREVLDQGFLSGREHWIISMPTGSGKTLLGEWALLGAVERGFKGVYLSPLKAIAEEKRNNWQARYPGIRFGIYTGDALKGGNRPTLPQPMSCFAPPNASTLISGVGKEPYRGLRTLTSA